jgi:hypothetical protein
MSTETGTPAADPAEQMDSDGLLSQLRLIEDQPLEDRASAFTQVHDRLRSALEGGDNQHRHA